MGFGQKLIKMNNKKSIRGRSEGIYIFLLMLILSFSYLYVFSTSLSPFYRYPFLYDSGIFQIIGKGWTEGIIPYRDLWDNKGPLLYLINALGFLLTNNRYGVFILQVINLSIALYIIFRIFRLKYNPTISILCTAIILLWLPNTNLDNNPAEWLLIPLCLSFYFLYKWLRDESTKELSWSSTFVFGVTIGCAFLLRLSDCLPLMVSLFVCVIYLIIDGKWIEIVRYAGICLVGFSIVVLPFVIYFTAIGALQEIWYASFLHNFSYVQNSKFMMQSLYALGSLTLSYAIYIGAILSGLLIIYLRLPSRKTAFVWLVASSITLIFISRVFARSTYGLSSLPLACFVVFQTDELIKSYAQTFANLCRGVIVSLVLVVFIFQLSQQLTSDHSTELAFYKQLEQKIPSEDRNSFIGYDVFPDTYYYTSLKPIHRFFVTYAGCMGEKDSLIKKIRKEYKQHKAKWVLVRHTRNIFFIEDILQKNYRVAEIYPSMGYTLYRLI